jgi:hypothetical protein
MAILPGCAPSHEPSAQLYCAKLLAMILYIIRPAAQPISRRREAMRHGNFVRFRSRLAQ